MLRFDFRARKIGEKMGSVVEFLTIAQVLEKLLKVSRFFALTVNTVNTVENCQK